MATRSVTLLKHGKPVCYLRCECCEMFSRGLSPRGWCHNCETEFARVQAKEAARKAGR